MFASWLARQAYSLVLRLLVPAYLWRVWSRGRDEPTYRLAWPARLGLYPWGYRAAVGQGLKQGAASARPLVWIHAVSLGETLAARPLVDALRSTWPGMRLLLTHGTATGREAGRALLTAQDLQTWLPLDTPGAVGRFLRAHRPAIGVLMETEIWPNLQHHAARMGVPMVLANARLSDKSLRQARRLHALMRPAAQSLSLVLAQTGEDARRLREAGVTAPVHVCGNVKFDLQPDAALIERGKGWRRAGGRPIVLAAVTREGEEAELLDAWQRRFADERPDGVPRLLIVPRHPQRFDEVAALVQARGMRVSRRSGWPEDGPDADARQAAVWLGDSMGEMPAYYAAAEAALLGGSFAPLGGQNLIEAAACGCPLVMGPHTFNFQEAAALSLAAGASVRVSSLAEAVGQAAGLIDSGRREQMSQAGLAFAGEHRGAALRMASLMDERFGRPA